MKTIYDSTTGIVRLTGTFDDVALALNLQDGESVYDGYVDGSSHKLVDGNVVPLEKTINVPDWIRAQRRSLLEESDWTQVADSPLNAEARSEWQMYRQDLRDLPSKYANAKTKFEVEFPEPPEN